MAKSTKRAAASSSLVVRNVKFEIGPQVPRYWHGGRRSLTIFMNNLSIFFPEGERFFIRSVKEQVHKVKSAKVAAEARDFYVQEAYHTREHERYNDMLREQGYPIDRLEKRIRWILKNVGRGLPKRFHLAATCSLEHFTALMAHFLLNDPRLLAGAHPAMAALWRWHAAEENEHKAVAFDVYKEAGGNYPERAVVMFCTTVIFWGLVIDQQARLMKTEGIAGDAKEWAALFKFLFVEPGGMFGLARGYLDYYRPGFHPWDFDNRDLLEKWKREFAVNKAYKAA